MYDVGYSNKGDRTMTESKQMTREETIRFFAGIGIGLLLIVLYMVWLRII